jgi:hypothetical protein
VSGDFRAHAAQVRYVSQVKRLLLVAALGGCGFGSTALDLPHDASNVPPPAIDAMVVPPPIDAAAPIDGVTPPALDSQTCFGHGLVKVCFNLLPSDPITLTSAMSPYDTGIDANCPLRFTQAGVELCVIAGRSVSVPSAFVAIGTRPLVVVGIEDVTIESGGAIDVSSKTGVRKGAGANTGTCSSGAAAENDDGGGGGGGGGGLGTAGGQGGEGDHNRNTPLDGVGNGGAAGSAQTVTTLRGGCAGGKGGDGAQAGGAGGDGGGGVYVIAGRKLTIAGDVFASGGGGAANNNNAGIEQGGGGGGAGGVIGLDAATLDITGRVAANGGAGGGGGGGGSGATGGKSGEDGSTTLWNMRARHGDAGPGNDGVGADGTAVGKIDLLTPHDGMAGGGGAAGGLGFVRIDGNFPVGAQISPAPTPH